MAAMNFLPRRLVLIALAASALAAHAQAANKVAVTSLVGDTLTVSTRRDATGTHLRHHLTTVVAMPGPALDLAVLTTVQEALRRAAPTAETALLRVPAAGTPQDPAQMLAGGQAAAGNPLIEGLRQAGYTHLVTVTRLKANNRVAVEDGEIVGSGFLEGLGFYADPTVAVQRRGAAPGSQPAPGRGGTSQLNFADLGAMDARSGDEGLLAPHVYVRLSLVDLASGQVRAVQDVTASSVAPAGPDLWQALSAQQKLDALQGLIRTHVAEAAARLLTSK
jgi:hypothetical protein